MAKRIQAGWDNWRKVTGVLCDKKAPSRIKGRLYKLGIPLTSHVVWIRSGGPDDTAGKTARDRRGDNAEVLHRTQRWIR